MHAFDAKDWGASVAHRFTRALGIEKVLYLTADRGVPVRGSKGASVHVRSVVRALDGLGVESLVLTTRPGPEDGPTPAARIVKSRIRGRLERLARRMARWSQQRSAVEKQLLRLLDNLALYREGRRQARAWHPDLLYERYALCSVAGSLLARRLGIPHFLEVNAPLADEEARFRGLWAPRLTRWLEGWILRRADKVIVVSSALEAHARSLGVSPDRILVLPNAVDPQLFHPRRDGWPVRERYDLQTRFVVGFSGSLKPWHGVDRVLGALASVARQLPQIHLLVVGDGPRRQQLEELAHRLGIDDRVHFVGSVAHDRVADYLAACDVLVAPYLPVENFYFSPLKIVEYLAMGRPVIASDIGQIREAFDGARGVVRVPPADETHLAQQIVELALDETRRRRLGRAAASSSSWTWEHLARQVLDEGEQARSRAWAWDCVP
jgi:glycosyltransferase involved in cell wall biosynthesis